MSPSRPARLLAVAAIIAIAACGGSSSHPGTTQPLGAPITGLAAGTWTWVDFPDSACGDGSATGIGVNPGSGPDLVFFLDGGGACASGVTCFGTPISPATVTTGGPFGAAQFDARKAEVAGSILDRSLVGSPFADATLVFVPYCTGDVHGGDRTVTYPDAGGRAWHHAGHPNLLAFLKRVAATWPTPRRVVVTGSSAGGFGTLVNYAAVRSYFPSAQGFAVDDSGPPLPGDPGQLISAGLLSWGIADAVDPVCGGPGICEGDLSKIVPALAASYPHDRFALLSSSRDATITLFYFATPDDFAARLTSLVTGPVAAAPNFRAFIVPGVSHTMLGAPASFSQGGANLVPWLAAEVSGSADWATVRP